MHPLYVALHTKHLASFSTSLRTSIVQQQPAEGISHLPVVIRPSAFIMPCVTILIMVLVASSLPLTSSSHVCVQGLII
jgi:ABC-type lipoprotein release transport system permease subunit